MLLSLYKNNDYCLFCHTISRYKPGKEWGRAVDKTIFEFPDADCAKTSENIQIMIKFSGSRRG
jgi:hypothetical protein